MLLGGKNGNNTDGENKNQIIFKPEYSEIWVTDFTEEAALSFHERVLMSFEADPFRPISIHINSYGGEVDALFSMLDTMDIVRGMAPEEFMFLTSVMGKALSAGATLLSYGDYRFATPNSRIMLHQVVGGTWGHQPDNEVEFNEIGRLNSKILQILRKRCKLDISLSEFKAVLGHNLYMTPEKAKEFGIIDIIGYPKIVEQTIYDVMVVEGKPVNKRGTNANRRANKKASEN